MGAAAAGAAAAAFAPAVAYSGCTALAGVVDLVHTSQGAPASINVLPQFAQNAMTKLLLFRIRIDRVSVNSRMFLDGSPLAPDYTLQGYRRAKTQVQSPRR